MRFKGDIIITDPSYVCKDGDWEKCRHGERMDILGIKNYMCIETIFGDWSCTTFNSDTNEPIGKFCADSGMVGVFLLNEVLSYDLDYNDYEKIPHTTTLIKSFEGDVEFIVENNGVLVVGKGNINFIGRQTGL